MAVGEGMGKVYALISGGPETGRREAIDSISSRSE